MKFLATVCIVSAVVVSAASATEPTPSKIVYEGKEYELWQSPMVPFFDTHPDKEPKSEIWSTGRGQSYIAVYQIETNHLVLKDITVDAWKDGGPDTEEKSVKDAVTPGGKDMIVTNYSGILILRDGEIIRHDDFSRWRAYALYSNYILIEIKKGRVTEIRSYNHKQFEAFKDRQFHAYKGTAAYLDDVRKFTSKDDTEEEIDALLRKGFLNSTSEFLDKEEKIPNIDRVRTAP